MASPLFSSANTRLYVFILFMTVAWNASAAPSEEIDSSWNDHDRFAAPLLLRLKRNPYKTFTYSGFNPNNGMTALASSAEYHPAYYYPGLTAYQNYHVRERDADSSPTSPADSNYSPDPPQSSAQYDPSLGANVDADRKLQPSPDLTPPAAADEAPASSYGLNPKVPKKQKPARGDDDDDDDGWKSKSKSSASFNAWFPIMVGWGSTSPSGNGRGNGADASGRFPGTTVIANSVSHGRSSVANSHAIAYGGDPLPMRSSYQKTQ